MQPDQTLQRLKNGELKGATRLKLSCNLTSFPEEIFSLADTLEVLDLSNNQLSALPDTLTKLKKLTVFFGSNNPFDHVPEVLGKLPALSMVGFKACQIKTVSAKALPKKLRWLILTDNQLSEIPPAIGSCSLLEKCMLAGNNLSSLPDTMQQCKNLALLRISANQFKTIPSWLLEMPKLAWLALAGNPFNASEESNVFKTSTLPNISWKSITLNHQLGEGASGIISHATLHEDQNNTAQSVAVKLFKGDMTSDGLPQSEMAAFIAAGKHANLSNVEGVITAHPEQKQGIVMSLIPPTFTVLANPPSLSSCTRDVYEETVLNTAQVLGIATGVASAASHLHHHGLMHGDLYAHNILYTAEGLCLLSDFGGASFAANNKVLAAQLERIEVRAFGYLLEELIALHDAEISDVTLKQLTQIKNNCLNDAPATRPLFSALLAQLELLTH